MLRKSTTLSILLVLLILAVCQSALAMECPVPSPRPSKDLLGFHKWFQERLYLSRDKSALFSHGGLGEYTYDFDIENITVTDFADYLVLHYYLQEYGYIQVYKRHWRGPYLRYIKAEMERLKEYASDAELFFLERAHQGVCDQLTVMFSAGFRNREFNRYDLKRYTPLSTCLLSKGYLKLKDKERRFRLCEDITQNLIDTLRIRKSYSKEVLKKISDTVSKQRRSKADTKSEKQCIKTFRKVWRKWGKKAVENSDASGSLNLERGKELHARYGHLFSDPAIVQAMNKIKEKSLGEWEKEIRAQMGEAGKHWKIKKWKKDRQTKKMERQGIIPKWKQVKYPKDDVYRLKPPKYNSPRPSLDLLAFHKWFQERLYLSRDQHRLYPHGVASDEVEYYFKITGVIIKDFNDYLAFLYYLSDPQMFDYFNDSTFLGETMKEYSEYAQDVGLLFAERAAQGHCDKYSVFFLKGRYHKKRSLKRYGKMHTCIQGLTPDDNAAGNWKIILVRKAFERFARDLAVGGYFDREEKRKISSYSDNELRCRHYDACTLDDYLKAYNTLWNTWGREAVENYQSPKEPDPERSEELYETYGQEFPPPAWEQAMREIKKKTPKQWEREIRAAMWPDGEHVIIKRQRIMQRYGGRTEQFDIGNTRLGRRQSQGNETITPSPRPSRGLVGFHTWFREKLFLSRFFRKLSNEGRAIYYPYNTNIKNISIEDFSDYLAFLFYLAEHGYLDESDALDFLEIELKRHSEYASDALLFFLERAKQGKCDKYTVLYNFGVPSKGDYSGNYIRFLALSGCITETNAKWEGSPAEQFLLCKTMLKDMVKSKIGRSGMYLSKVNEIRRTLKYIDRLNNCSETHTCTVEACKKDLHSFSNWLGWGSANSDDSSRVKGSERGKELYETYGQHFPDPAWVKAMNEIKEKK